MKYMGMLWACGPWLPGPSGGPNAPGAAKRNRDKESGKGDRGLFPAGNSACGGFFDHRNRRPSGMESDKKSDTHLLMRV